MSVKRWMSLKTSQVLLNTGGGTRIHTEEILSPLPLPIGLRRHDTSIAWIQAEARDQSLYLAMVTIAGTHLHKTCHS